MIEINTCPICNGQILKNKITAKDHTVSGEIFTIKECANCGLGITTPRPEDAELGKYYLSEEYISHSGKAASLIDSMYLLARKFTLRGKTKLLKELSTEKTVLDFGSGTGEFLSHLASNGYQVLGVEPSVIARQKANALLQKETVFETLNQISINPAIITLWHVLEHVPDPLTKLREIATKLAVNGTIVIAVPNPNSWESTHYGEHWAGYDVPRHLWHFSQKSMNLLLRNAGLNLIDTRPMILDAYYISLLSRKYQKNGTMNLIGMISAFFTGISSNINARKTGEYSSLIYIVKK